MQSLIAKVQAKINRIPEGKLITFADLLDKNSDPKAIAVIVSRLNKRGKLLKVGKGKYYRPQETKFGSLPPSDNQILATVLESSKGKLNGYISGITAYNQMGLTTQLPTKVLIVGATSTRESRYGKLKVKFIKNPIKLTNENKKLLPILDAIRDYRKIPDTSPAQVFSKVKLIIGELGAEERRRLAGLSLQYRPKVRALLGAILQELREYDLVAKLKASLNPISVYSLGANMDMFRYAKNWNIK